MGLIFNFKITKMKLSKFLKETDAKFKIHKIVFKQAKAQLKSLMQEEIIKEVQKIENC